MGVFIKFFLSFCFLLFVNNAFSLDLVFKQKGLFVDKISLSKINSGKLNIKNSEIKSSTIKLFNVFRTKETFYKAYPFYELLNAIYGIDWQNKEKISFTSVDGYHQVALIAPMLKVTKNKIGYLAFAEEGLNGFGKFQKKGKWVDPGPLYLVWTNFSEKDKASHGDIIKWPYQLIEINIE